MMNITDQNEDSDKIIDHKEINQLIFNHRPQRIAQGLQKENEM